MDVLTLTVCLCIGNAVAWLIALYSERGMYALIWNVFFGIVGATAAAALIAWLAPPPHMLWLLIAGPFAAWLAIRCGEALRRAVRRPASAAAPPPEDR